MNFVLWPWSNSFSGTAYQAAFIFPLAWLYSLALIRGIACARDEQHRMTPLSPWFYFWMKAKRPVFLIAVLSFPWLLMGNVMLWIGVLSNYRGFLDWGEAISVLVIIDDYYRTEFASCLPYFFGLACFNFAVITRVAPRYSNAFPLTAVGWCSVLIFWGIFLATMDALYELGFGSALIGLALLGLFGFLSLTLTWLHVRFRLNRAWFRFEDS